GRPDGTPPVGVHVAPPSSDASRDSRRAVRRATSAAPGETLSVPDTSVEGNTEYGGAQRLQELLRTDTDLEVTLHEDFSWWLPEDTEATGDIAMSLQRANEAIQPTVRLGSGMYWVDAGSKAHLRWVRTEPETRLLQAMA